mmetsp:Transcript_127896/g.409703  ORF Transcript_127896/g.409703 Transcript_127896/m.409703 type:complete len:497 (-) Transcript_127896:55-1545(-)
MFVMGLLLFACEARVWLANASWCSALRARLRQRLGPEVGPRARDVATQVVTPFDMAAKVALVRQLARADLDIEALEAKRVAEFRAIGQLKEENRDLEDQGKDLKRHLGELSKRNREDVTRNHANADHLERVLAQLQWFSEHQRTLDETKHRYENERGTDSVKELQEMVKRRKSKLGHESTQVVELEATRAELEAIDAEMRNGCQQIQRLREEIAAAEQQRADERMTSTSDDAYDEIGASASGAEGSSVDIPIITGSVLEKARAFEQQKQQLQQQTTTPPTSPQKPPWRPPQPPPPAPAPAQEFMIFTGRNGQPESDPASPPRLASAPLEAILASPASSAMSRSRLDSESSEEEEEEEEDEVPETSEDENESASASASAKTPRQPRSRHAGHGDAAAPGASGAAPLPAKRRSPVPALKLPASAVAQAARRMPTRPESECCHSPTASLTLSTSPISTQRRSPVPSLNLSGSPQSTYRSRKSTGRQSTQRTDKAFELAE